MGNEWIKVSECLPPMGARVLMCIKEPKMARQSIIIGKRIPHDTTDPNNPRWHWSQVVRDTDVTHWQRLPQLPNDNG
ncbi:DUF551 domain-containing protein [Barnesiella sp. WM24]|uniref:DUF551 domain-containing protein n=1 Tax=Barnesiella sp. WM24 TaxID=2558278 RepID=UPI0010727748